MAKPKGSVRVNAAQMQAALETTVPKSRAKRPGDFPITLSIDSKTKLLDVSEAKHGERGGQLAAEGKWPLLVQVDGRRLKALFDTYPDDAQVELAAFEDGLAVLYGRSQVRLTRYDAGGATGIERVPMPPDKRHKGKVEVPPDPVGKRVELADTWGFSVRVPMPQHRDPKE